MGLMPLHRFILRCNCLVSQARFRNLNFDGHLFIKGLANRIGKNDIRFIVENKENIINFDINKHQVERDD